MPITKEKKKEIVSDLEKGINNSKSVVFVNFHGISVADSGALRRSLMAEGVKFSVAKKTLIKRALDSIKISGSRPELGGELALALGDDSLTPARGVYEFQKKLTGKISILGGIFDRVYKSQAEMIEIASIPSLQVLRGMFVNIINSPVQRFVIGLDQISKTKK